MNEEKIYTKKGDKGQTSTMRGKISKSDELAEALGTIDELNSWLGVYREQILNSKHEDPNKFKIPDELKKIQSNLMTVNAILAGANKEFKAYETKHLENLIDKLQAKLPKLANFIYPMGELQYARAVARRTERKVVSYQLSVASEATIDKNILKYLNRLSDALFVIARYVNAEKGINEEAWK